MSKRTKPKPRLVVFLDFDGVLNSVRSMREHGTNIIFGRPDVAALNSILAHEPNIEIVISSDWRYSRNLRTLQVALDHQGVMGALVVGMTPKWGKDRGSEIASWLDAQPTDRPIRFVALDDDHEGMGWMGERHIATNSEYGLTDEHVAKALELLRRA